ncbi:MAG: hypothetical protein QNJ65_08880 [Xenococcaceae cyanobacterium MO_234.B1]|nr:hypothetical protein [Xenococcaceae cyanobacterium MO_234.B1]
MDDEVKLITSEINRIKHFIKSATNRSSVISQLVAELFHYGITYSDLIEKEALVFTFIAELNLASGKAAPLMMDTPFGKLDKIHQENIVKSLPNIDSQVILLATDRDLPDHLLQQLKPNVAQIHKIRRLGGIEDASVVEVEE